MTALGFAQALVAQLAEAGGLNPPECGFESRRGHQNVVVQTSDVSGLICPVSACCLAGEGGGLDFGVQHVSKGTPGSASMGSSSVNVRRSKKAWLAKSGLLHE